MSTIKNIVVQGISVAILGAAYMIGAGFGQKVWENGLDDKVDEMTEKWFSK